MIGEINLRTKSICIPLSSIFTSYLLIETRSKSLGHDLLLDLFYGTNRLLRKAITPNFPLSKPVSLANCMLSRDATVSHKFSPLKSNI